MLSIQFRLTIGIGSVCVSYLMPISTPSPSYVLFHAALNFSYFLFRDGGIKYGALTISDASEMWSVYPGVSRLKLVNAPSPSFAKVGKHFFKKSSSRNRFQSIKHDQCFDPNRDSNFITNVNCRNSHNITVSLILQISPMSRALNSSVYSSENYSTPSINATSGDSVCSILSGS